MVDLARLKQLADAATPGPWAWNPDGQVDARGELRKRMFLEARGRLYQHVLKVTWPELLRDEDADYIAAFGPSVGVALVRVAEAASALIDWSALPGEAEHWRALRVALDALREQP